MQSRAHGLVVRVIGKGVGVFLGIGEIDALAVDDDPRKLSSVRTRLEGYGDFLAILKVAGEAAVSSAILFSSPFTNTLTFLLNSMTGFLLKSVPEKSAYLCAAAIQGDLALLRDWECIFVIFQQNHALVRQRPWKVLHCGSRVRTFRPWEKPQRPPSQLTRRSWRASGPAK